MILDPFTTVSISEALEAGLYTFDAGFASDKACVDCDAIFGGWRRSQRCLDCAVRRRKRLAAARARRRYVPAGQTGADRATINARQRCNYRKRNPLPDCIDCGEQIIGRRADAKRCHTCGEVDRRARAAERQRNYQQRKKSQGGAA